MRVDVMTQSGAYIEIDVVYYYFSIDNTGTVTEVNYSISDPNGPFSGHSGDFNSFKASYHGFLFIPVPRGAT